MICYTDGSTLGNGKAHNTGGFGIIILSENNEFITCYQEKSFDTTNNREELKAILYVVAYLLQNYPDEHHIIYSDSGYSVNTINNWMWNWAKNDWRKSDKKVPENLDLISQLYSIFNEYGTLFTLRQCPGHSNVFWNEMADKLATFKITSEEVEKLYGGK